MGAMLEMNLCRDKAMEIQIAAAKWSVYFHHSLNKPVSFFEFSITYLCRAGGTSTDHRNPIQDVILHKVSCASRFSLLGYTPQLNL